MTDHRFNATIGTYADEHASYRVKVEARIEHGTDGREQETVLHEKITAPVRFAITGVETSKLHTGKRWEESSAGQNIDALRAVTDFEPGWDAAKRDRLVVLWEKWHLNDMQAGCAHQTVEYETGPYGRRPSLTATKPCPESGYRYGSAWLVKPLPTEVISEITDLFTKANV